VYEANTALDLLIDLLFHMTVAVDCIALNHLA